eukprot:2504026-Rhodomonas_salina.1
MARMVLAYGDRLRVPPRSQYPRVGLVSRRIASRTTVFAYGVRVCRTPPLSQHPCRITLRYSRVAFAYDGRIR